ncbi:endonuclease/exonuclease/phosphatase family protein [Fusobacterium sp.]|uniref:endonuclease/exonuclease/phosphatase family protein n=1 Tax=Fusobacterium sp. TaxID=68766 RepID=UPI0025BEA01F|nr:endonuclease/exonuclease/phosphatase family protein [Fusobacterium sp.]
MVGIKRVILYLLLSFSLFAQEAYIASFNTLRLGKSQKDYKLLSNVLKNFDIVGLVEVMSVEGLEKLVKELEKESGEKWEYHISPYSVGRHSYKEYYAYVWKKERVNFLQERGFYPDEKDEFERPPYGADFKIDNFDFTMIMVHTIFGKKESQRRAEAFKIDKVYDYFQNLDESENDIIIAGDFNLSAQDEAFENIVKHNDEIIYTVSPKIKTTIGKEKLANSYDNMFLSKIYTQEFDGKSGALDFTKKKYKLMREKISDHLPIFIVVNTEFDDD